jgi:hypothetical protein
VWRPDVSGVCSVSDPGRPPVEWTCGCGKDGGSANFLYWLVAESRGAVLPCKSVLGLSDIFELWFRIVRGCRVFGNRDQMSR